MPQEIQKTTQNFHNIPLQTRRKSINKKKQKKSTIYKITNMDQSYSKSLQVNFKPEYLRNMNKFYHTDYCIVISASKQVELDQILGEIEEIMFSGISKINQVQFNHLDQAVSIKIEVIQQQKVPIEYVKQRFNSFQDEESHRTVQILEKISNGFKKEDLKNSTDQDYITKLLSQEEMPSFIYKVKCQEKLETEFIYNENYIKLAGVQPNILIDAILQGQKLPDITKQDQRMWNNSAENYFNGLGLPLDLEYNTLITTYEGMKVEVKIRETHLVYLCQETNVPISIRKMTFQILNPRVYQTIFNEQRITKNSLHYLKQNKTLQANNQMYNQLLTETNCDIKFKYKKLGPCGFKMKKQN